MSVAINECHRMKRQFCFGINVKWQANDDINISHEAMETLFMELYSLSKLSIN